MAGGTDFLPEVSCSREEGQTGQRKIIGSCGNMPLPTKMTYEPTEGCNLACKMCDRHRKPSEVSGHEMAFPEVKVMLGSLPDSIRSCYISGGEPMMRKDIKPIVGLMLKKGLKVSLQTNASLTKRVLELAGSAQDFSRPVGGRSPGLAMLYSLDGTEVVHDSIRGMPGLFKRNLFIFKRSSLLPALNSRLPVITTVIIKENLENIPEMLRELCSQGIGAVFIIELARSYTKKSIRESAGLLGLDVGDIPMHTVDSLMPGYSFGRFSSALEQIDRALNENGFRYCYFPKELFKKPGEYYYLKRRSKNRLYCTAMHELRVDSGGNMIYCHVIRKKFGKLGEQPFESLWNSPGIAAFRKRLLASNLAPVCERCYQTADEAGYIEYLNKNRMWSVDG